MIFCVKFICESILEVFPTESDYRGLSYVDLQKQAS